MKKIQYELPIFVGVVIFLYAMCVKIVCMKDSPVADKGDMS